MTDKPSMHWYRFNFADYTSDTARLSCEANGAYILLIADYYNTKSPPPDDDEVLAAITKLPVETWQKHRKVIERFFTIEAGYWKHERIEKEMLRACSKYAASIAHAKLAAEGRWGKEGTKPVPSKGKRRSDTTSGPKNAPSMPAALPAAMPEHSPENAELELDPLNKKGGEEHPPEAVETDFGLGTQVPRDFLPSAETSDRARSAGMTVPEIDAEVRKFVATRQAEAAFSHDWQASFSIWIERQIEHRAKQAAKAEREVAKAPPRVEVSHKINSAYYQPTDAEYDRGVAMYAKGMPWSSQLGPEPGSRACRVPPAILDRHGIDPKTGDLKPRKVEA
jgi:uncharacterized protein YdaU (DUF1376 family)